jgi:hypothetical protein
VDPGYWDKVEASLDVLQSPARKYIGSVEAALAHQAELLVEFKASPTSMRASPIRESSSRQPKPAW